MLHGPISVISVFQTLTGELTSFTQEKYGRYDPLIMGMVVLMYAIDPV